MTLEQISHGRPCPVFPSRRIIGTIGYGATEGSALKADKCDSGGGMGEGLARPDDMVVGLRAGTNRNCLSNL